MGDTEFCLAHHGIKGQRWGVRRYQYKDGSLTPLGRRKYGTKTNFEKVQAAKRASSKEVIKKKKARAAAEERTQSEIAKYKKKANEDLDAKEKKEKAEAEDKEVKRTKALSSTDASEIYKNRDLLTTAEINERLTRIDTEARLAKVAEGTKVTGRDKVNDMLQKNADTIGKATNLFKRVDEAYSSVANSAIGKTLAKQLGIEPPRKEFNISDFMKNINKKTTQEIMDVNKRLTAEQSIRDKLKKDKNEQEAADRLQNAKKQVDDYNKSGYKDDRVSSSSQYNKSGKDVTDSKVGTGSKNRSNLRLETIDHFTATADDIIGKGRSKFEGFKNDSTIIDVYPSDVPSSVKQLGYTKVFGYLEDKGGR